MQNFFLGAVVGFVFFFSSRLGGSAAGAERIEPAWEEVETGEEQVREEGRKDGEGYTAWEAKGGCLLQGSLGDTSRVCIDSCCFGSCV